MYIYIMCIYIYIYIYIYTTTYLNNLDKIYRVRLSDIWNMNLHILFCKFGTNS